MNVYEIITDRIITELEKGIIPWQKPWIGVQSAAIKHVSGKPYSLLNQMLLGRPGEWLTLKQCNAEGGRVKAGEKHSIVVWGSWIKKTKKDKDGNEVEDTFYSLRFYNVFHIDQCEGIKPRYPEKPLEHKDPIAEAEDVLSGYIKREGIRFYAEKSNQAYYSPMLDEIRVPMLDQFAKPEEYYSTAFHESVHSTGHPSRLARLDMTARFGSEEYSKEELVAEIGAATLMNAVGIETEGSFRNSASYIGNWLNALKKDKRMIVNAAGKAEKAVKMILGEDTTTETKEEE